MSNQDSPTKKMGRPKQVTAINPLTKSMKEARKQQKQLPSGDIKTKKAVHVSRQSTGNVEFPKPNIIPRVNFLIRRIGK